MNSRDNMVGELKTNTNTEANCIETERALILLMREHHLTGDSLRALLKVIELDFMRFEDNIIRIKKAFKKASDIERVTIYRNELLTELDQAVQKGIITEEDKRKYANEFNEIGMNAPSI